MKNSLLLAPVLAVACATAQPKLTTINSFDVDPTDGESTSLCQEMGKDPRVSKKVNSRGKLESAIVFLVDNIQVKVYCLLNGTYDSGSPPDLVESVEIETIRPDGVMRKYEDGGQAFLEISGTGARVVVEPADGNLDTISDTERGTRLVKKTKGLRGDRSYWHVLVAAAKKALRLNNSAE